MAYAAPRVVAHASAKASRGLLTRIVIVVLGLRESGEAWELSFMTRASGDRVGRDPQ